MVEKTEIQEFDASFGVNASVPGPTGVRAKKLKGSKDQGDKSNPMQGSSVKSGAAGEMKPTASGGSSGGEGEINQGTSKIPQPKQVTKEDIDVSDDIAAIFNGADVSEEFVERAKEIFETAVITKINEKLAEIDEETNAEIENNVTEISEELVAKVNDYLDYVVENWMEENSLAVETGLRAEIVEDFMKGLRDLFTEHYIEIPEDKVDVVDEMAAQIADLEGKLSEAVTANVELKKINERFEREIALAEVAEGLTDTQAAKLESLAEAVDFETTEQFKEKLGVIRESYFTSNQNKTVVKTDLDEQEEINEEAQPLTGPMAAYAATLTRLANKA